MIDQIENRKALLLAEQADLMNSGFPATLAEEFRKRVNDLPEPHRSELEQLCNISESIKICLLNTFANENPWLPDAT